MAVDDLSGPARTEVERVLGHGVTALERLVVTAGTMDARRCFEVKGLDADWTWEVEVTDTGRLLEVEKERRRR